jgi:hypothetical protein
VSSIPREETLNYKKKEPNQRVPFVLTYHPRLRKLSTVLQKHFHLLKMNERLKKTFTDVPMVAFRRLQNLKDVLVHTGTTKQEGKGVKRCGDLRCKCCHHLVEESEVKINGKTQAFRGDGSCKSENIIYGIRCKRCSKWYVGESGLRLHNRISGHRASIKRLQKGEKLNSQLCDTGCAEHFNGDGHNFDQDAELHLLEKGEWVDPADRKKRESFLICKFRTMQSDMVQGGLNKTAGAFTDLYGKI